VENPFLHSVQEYGFLVVLLTGAGGECRLGDTGDCGRAAIGLTLMQKSGEMTGGRADKAKGGSGRRLTGAALCVLGISLKTGGGGGGGACAVRNMTLGEKGCSGTWGNLIWLEAQGLNVAMGTGLVGSWGSAGAGITGR